MNNPRRKELKKAIDLIMEARLIVEMVQEEEYDAFCNLPEGLQNSERGEAMEENANRLEDIAYSLGDFEDELEDIING